MIYHDSIQDSYNPSKLTFAVDIFFLSKCQLTGNYLRRNGNFKQLSTIQRKLLLCQPRIQNWRLFPYHGQTLGVHQLGQAGVTCAKTL
jgi:hypothetical protein